MSSLHNAFTLPHEFPPRIAPEYGVDKIPSESLVTAVLQNHLILETLFNFMSFKELCNARLVCRHWHYVSLPFWRSRGAVRISSNRGKGIFKNYLDLSALENFVNDTCSLPLTFPCPLAENERYRFGGWPYSSFKLRFFYNMQGCIDEVSNFWQRCGFWITYLELTHCRIHTIRQYKIFLLSEYTPNLKTFKITGWVYQSSEGDVSGADDYISKPNLNLNALSLNMCIPLVSWEEIFSCYPNLRKLELKNQLECAYWEGKFFEMIRSMAVIRKKNSSRLPIKYLNLQRINIRLCSSLSLESFYRNLYSLNLPLEVLILDIQLFTNANSLQAFLSTCKTTLRKLKLFCGSCSSLQESHFEISSEYPMLTKLEEFTLYADSFQNMEFLQYTPNLKLLHIICRWKWKLMTKVAPYPSKAFVSCSKNVVLPTVKSFRYDYDCTPVSLLKLMTWMPNVEELEMPLTNELFGLVCQHWKGLRKLTVLKDKLTDEGLVGRLFTGDRDALAKMTPIDRVEFFSDHSHPAITNFEYLHTFIMENRKYPTADDKDENKFFRSNNSQLPTQITEKSFRRGFMQMRNLQKLSISVDAEVVCANLVEKLRDVVPDVNITYCLHDIPWMVMDVVDSD